MELSSLANSWVESYLEALVSTTWRRWCWVDVDWLGNWTLMFNHYAQLSHGLSREHMGQVSDSGLADDKNVVAKLNVQRVLGLNEEGIRQAWSRVRKI
jgi:hypothetical protein